MAAITRTTSKDRHTLNRTDSIANVFGNRHSMFLKSTFHQQPAIQKIGVQ